jgi:hypothetical protein
MFLVISNETIPRNIRIYHKPLPSADGWNDIFDSIDILSYFNFVHDIPSAVLSPFIYFPTRTEASCWAKKVGLVDEDKYLIVDNTFMYILDSLYRITPSQNNETANSEDQTGTTEAV